jgi:virginiamycin B lyase
MTRKRTAAILLGALFAVAPAAHAVQITEFGAPTPGADPTGITAGPDGAIWYTEPSTGRIGRIPAAGALTEFPLPEGSHPGAIVTGPDGALWFTDAGRIGRITTSGAVTNFPVESGIAVMQDLTVGSDGNIWFAYVLLVPGPGALGRIGRLTPLGTMTIFEMPSPARAATSLAAGPDGRIWFAGYGLGSFGANAFGVVGALSTDGQGQSFATLGAAIPADITPGPDGNMWFTALVSASFGTSSSGPTSLGKIGRVGTDFTGLTEFSIPSPSTPSSIAAGPDGNLWFGDLARSAIGRVTPAGAITELAAPSPPGGIAAGSDGSVWFTEPQTGKIARVSALTTICTPSATALCLDNGRFRVEATWTTSDGATGAATAVPLGSSSTAGYLWFFSPETPEVTVKTIEGCSFNGNVWFFAGGLTNVRVDVKVTDMTVPNGAVSKTYTNPLGTPFQPIQDTAAFPCPASPIPPPVL